MEEQRQSKFATTSTSELVRIIARKYDDNGSYILEWHELVRRVGEEQAERLVDNQ